MFAERVAEAFDSRRVCEAELRYHLYVDCMPMDGVGELDQASLRRMLEWAQSAPGLNTHARCAFTFSLVYAAFMILQQWRGGGEGVWVLSLVKNSRIFFFRYELRLVGDQNSPF